MLIKLGKLAFRILAQTTKSWELLGNARTVLNLPIQIKKAKNAYLKPVMHPRILFWISLENAKLARTFLGQGKMASHASETLASNRSKLLSLTEHAASANNSLTQIKK
jgi:hypothetical protein